MTTRSRLHLRLPPWLLSIRPVHRGLVWLRALRAIRPEGGWRGRFALLRAALIDWSAYSFSRDASASPRARSLELVFAPKLGLWFHLRPGTDDLYNVLPGVEGDVERALLDPLQPGDVFVDVGANMGFYALQADQRVGPSGKVVAVEAVPPTCAQLRRNVEINRSRVQIVEVAVTETNGSARIVVPRGVFGMASVKELDGAEGHAFVVPAMTLDTICRDIPSIRMLKLDIEGAELAALRGAPVTLTRTQSVVVECNRDEAEIRSLLEAAGFSVRRMSFASYLAGVRGQPLGPPSR